jgi:hypothetical protein
VKLAKLKGDFPRTAVGALAGCAQSAAGIETAARRYTMSRDFIWEQWSSRTFE